MKSALFLEIGPMKDGLHWQYFLNNDTLITDLKNGLLALDQIFTNVADNFWFIIGKNAYPIMDTIYVGK